MAGAILEILGSQKMRLEMGRLGFEKYQAEFTVQRMAAETRAVYERLCAERTGVSATSRAEVGGVIAE